jgi:hypothetical protein
LLGRHVERLGNLDHGPAAVIALNVDGMFVVGRGDQAVDIFGAKRRFELFLIRPARRRNERFQRIRVLLAAVEDRLFTGNDGAPEQ